MHKIPLLLRYALAFTGVGLLLLFTLRLAFWLAFNNPSDPVPAGELLTAFYLGLKFDLRLLLLMQIPLLVLGGFPPLHPLFGNIGRPFWRLYLLLAGAVTLTFYTFDFGHYAYLQTRLDASALRFLDNLAISAQMMWETYPIIPIFAAFGLGLGVIYWGVGRLRDWVGRFNGIIYRWRGKLITSVVTFFMVVFGIYGAIAWYPLRWSDAFFGEHALGSAVALNPVLYFGDTYMNGGISYDEEKVRAHYPLMVDYLGIDKPNATTLSYRRERPTQTTVTGENRPNIVMVFLESFAQYKSSLSGNPLDPSPQLQSLAHKGLHFKNFYTPHTGTARSVFAAITGIPDVQANDTSSRNPAIVNQHTIANSFIDYSRYYFLGGSASWRNIRALLGKNIDDLQIFEEGSYQSPRIDVWGISDLHLFDEAHGHLETAKKPFFAIIQTSGNHRPYTIPEDHRGFELKQVSDAELHAHGFGSLDEYNAFRFMDHSIGHFMKLVEASSYRDNTIFAFFGDHGITGNAGKHSSAAMTQLNLGNLNVPLVIYAPGYIKQPRRISKVASEVDLLPTLSALAGNSYINTTLGRNLLNSRYDDNRYAFTFQYGTLPEIGVISKTRHFRMRTDGTKPVLFDLTSDNPRHTLNETEPEQTEQLRNLTEALYQTAKYMLNHNGRELAETK